MLVMTPPLSPLSILLFIRYNFSLVNTREIISPLVMKCNISLI